MPIDEDMLSGIEINHCGVRFGRKSGLGNVCLFIYVSCVFYFLDEEIKCPKYLCQLCDYAVIIIISKSEAVLMAILSNFSMIYFTEIFVCYPTPNKKSICMTKTI